MLSFIKQHLFFLLLILLSIIVALVIFKNQTVDEHDIVKDKEIAPIIKNDENNNAEDDIEVNDPLIKVDIKGEVTQPGVYEIDENLRVIDIIQTAGGLTSEADESQINLAQKVTDEMVIIVPKLGEEIPQNLLTLNSGGRDDTNKIMVNQATIDELSTLNGVGPKKAQAIVDYREDHGLFEQIEDILNVSGIGEKTLESFKDDITIH